MHLKNCFTGKCRLTISRIDYISESEIFFSSCTEIKYVNAENLVPEHAIVHIYSGKMMVMEPEKLHTFDEGDTVFFPRNQLGKFTKYPSKEAPITLLMLASRYHCEKLPDCAHQVICFEK